MIIESMVDLNILRVVKGIIFPMPQLQIGEGFV
jgi:hypothetical protein